MSTMREKKIVREKAIRGMFSGLLGSSLSLDELTLLTREMNQELLVSVRDHLMDYLSRREYEAPTRWPVESNVSVSSYDKEALAEHIYLVAKAKRIGKDRLLGYIRKIDPHFDQSLFQNAFSVRDIVFQYVLGADLYLSTLLMDILGKGIEEDPYLRGISSEKRK